MLLAFDAGNTNVKVALFRDGEIAARWRLGTDSALTEDDFGATLLRLLRVEGFEAKDVTGVALASVVPGLTDSLADGCSAYLDVSPFVVDGDARIPLDSEYEKTLGIDRLMGVVAAAEHYGPGPLVIVDLGTAVKFDALDAGGIHIGGAIAPGIGISSEALFSRVARIARSTVIAPQSAVGRNNAAAVNSGVVLGYAGMIDGMVQRFSDEMGGATRVIATGGWARVLQSVCKFDVVDPDLTVKGIRIVYELNARQ